MPRVSKEDLNELIFRVDEDSHKRWRSAVEKFSIATKRNIRSDCNLLARFNGTKEYTLLTIEVISQWVDHMIVTEESALESVLRRLRSIRKVVKIVGGINPDELDYLYWESSQRQCKTVINRKLPPCFSVVTVNKERMEEPEYCRNAVIVLLVREGMKSEEISVLKRSDFFHASSQFRKFIDQRCAVKELVERWVNHFPNLDLDFPLLFPFTPRGTKPIQKHLHYSTVWKIKCKFIE